MTGVDIVKETYLLFKSVLFISDEPLHGNLHSANKLLLTEHKSKNLWERDRSPYPQQRPGIHFQTSQPAQQSVSSRQP